MGRLRWAGVTAALAIAATAQAQAQIQAAGPMLHPDEQRQVSPHVWVIPDGSRGLVPNVGIIVGRKGVLVVDTGLGPENGALAYAAAVKAAPGRQVYLMATHAHPEHDLGAQAFPAGTKLIRSSDQIADAPNDVSLAKVFSNMNPRNAELLKDAAPRPADISFAGTYDLDLGGVTARLEALGPAHTAGDTIVWVAADKVLFSGDLAMKAQPAIVSPKATLAGWRRVLAREAALKPKVVVPSHGPVGDAGFITGYRDYLAEVAERTAKAKAAGLDAAAAASTVTTQMQARYPDKGRLASAIRLAYAEAP
jgi:glyoxylase-like metal-dependent hydrolase (beta-lactamase superfamily II)